ncbi:cytidine deaminase [Halolamina pelagica]|uniref:Cytidine deaminase n=1 Tax=Halolamina pelagica TaxID=699431 RepID=A0A0P7HCF2_9EURY|nr:cytidine deaminase [Halolamina pelagica]KPN31200.1 cytidine deaminase [Halolamina pelagica]
MDTSPLTDADDALLDHATDLNRETFDAEFFDGAHIVAASVRTADGAVYDGVSLPASIGRASTCAEPGAVSAAIADGHSHDDIEACVAVAYPMPEHDADDARPIPPCGVCRELLADYNPEMRVVVPVDGSHELSTATEQSDAGDGDGALRTVRAEALLPIRPW